MNDLNIELSSSKKWIMDYLLKVQKDLLKKKPHPHRQPMKRLNSGTVIIKEEPKQRRREPIIKILLKEDEGNNNLSPTLIHSFIVAALLKEWTKQSKIFEPSKSRCYEKHVIQQIIRFDKKDTIKCFLESLPLSLKIDPFHQSTVCREQGSDKI